MQISSHMFQSLVEESPDAISVLNHRGEILYGSASHTKLFGLRSDEVVGRSYTEFFHPEDREHSASLIEKVIYQPSESSSWDARVRRKDGTYCWVESTVSNLMNGQELQALVLHQRDIHERMEARANGLKLIEELTQSNLRMEEFAYTIAHDMKEPLRSISLCMQFLFAKVEMDAESQQLAKFVIDGAGRLSAMVTDLLSFARTGIDVTPVILDLNHVVAKALQNLLLEIQESEAAVVVDELPTVRSDETKLVRLIQNLVSNAVKYRSQRPLIIRLSAKREGKDWVIIVKDNGLGIAKEYQAKVFMPFVRLVKRGVPGTGLGLAVCTRIMESLGGSIWVDSESDIGSTFSFTIDADLSDPASKALPVA